MFGSKKGETYEEKKDLLQIDNNKFHLLKRIPVKERFNFYEYIATMIDGWVTVTDALESILWRVWGTYFWEKIKELRLFISSWDSFSKAMKKMPDVFPTAEAAVVQAWEESWNLVQSLNKLGEDLISRYELSQKIKWAMTYPIIIFLFLLLAMGIVLIYVMPEVKEMFVDQWIDLPAATVALIATSDFLVNHYILILFMLICFVAFLIVYTSTETGKRFVNYFFINAPLIWKVYRNSSLAHIAWSIGSLNAGWISIVKTLKLVGESTWSYIYKNLLYDIAKDVAAGKTLVESMWERDPHREFFPHDFLQMFSVWEKTATLEDVCKKIKVQYTKEVDYSLASLVKWIEPIAILFAWVFVLWFAFAVFWAILEMTDSAWV